MTVHAMQLNGVGALRALRAGSSRSQPASTSCRPVHLALQRKPAAITSGAVPYRRYVTVMGNKGENGPFAPLVRAVREVMGTKEFNKFRGQMISLHSQVIKDFGKQIGADVKQVQGLIRLAKKNGEKLGFLA